MESLFEHSTTTVPASVAFMIEDTNKALCQLDEQTQHKLKGHHEKLRPLRVELRSVKKELESCFTKWHSQKQLTNNLVKNTKIHFVLLFFIALAEVPLTYTALQVLDLDDYLTYIIAVPFAGCLVYASKWLADCLCAYFITKKTSQNSNNEKENFKKDEAIFYLIFGSLVSLILLVAMIIPRYQYYVLTHGQSFLFVVGLTLLHIAFFSALVFVYSRLIRHEQNNVIERRYHYKLKHYKQLLSKHDAIAKKGNSIFREYIEQRNKLIHICFQDIASYLRHLKATLNPTIEMTERWFKPSTIDKNLFTNLDLQENVFEPEIDK